MAAAKKRARKPSRHKASKAPRTKGRKTKPQKSTKRRTPSKASKVAKTGKVSKTSKPRKPLTSITILIVSPGIVSAGQQYLQVADNTQFFFKNSSTLDLNLNFTNPFGKVSDPKGQTVGPISAAGIAISYTITDTAGNLTGGPYAVRWDNGVLEITIDSDAPDFDPVAVVPGGLIHYTALDGDYAIKWQNQNGQQVNIWSPQPAVIYGTPAPNPVQRAMSGVNGPYDYALTAKNLAIGGGTVKVGS